MAVLRGLEFIVLAASLRDAKPGERGGTFGVLGSDLYAASIGELESAGAVVVPADRGGASLGTYVMPCRSFGLLETGVDDLPVRIPPRGQALQRARSGVLAGSRVAECILKGGTLSLGDPDGEAQYFSVNNLGAIEEERSVLEDALLRPHVQTEETLGTYERFLATSQWAFKALDGHAMSSSELIFDAYRAASSGASSTAVTLAWTEYELRRRGHFAVELLLSSLADTLMDLTEATVDQVVDAWDDDAPLPEVVATATGWSGSSFKDTVADLAASVPSDAFLVGPLRGSVARSLTSRARTLYACALLLACRKQTEELRKTARLPARRSYLERVFGILDEADTQPLSETTKRLLREVVVEAHLSTTLRKMSQGQKCSLRFYPEGALLRPTGTPVAAGFSGDRLGNVLGIWADLRGARESRRRALQPVRLRTQLGGEARAMRSDLLKAIAGSKEVTNAIILTHNIDFVFLQTVVLAALRKCGHPTITVFADAQCAAESFAHQAPVLDGLGVRYRVVPVAMSPGFRFHPKAVLLSGEKEATLFVGSGNLTFGGWRENAEVWMRFSPTTRGFASPSTPDHRRHREPIRPEATREGQVPLQMRPHRGRRRRSQAHARRALQHRLRHSRHP